jgi:predicted metalloprotease
MTDENKQIVVTRRGGGGSGLGLILGILIVILIVGAVWYFGFGPGHVAQSGTTINVNLPSLPANPYASP